MAEWHKFKEEFKTIKKEMGEKLGMDLLGKRKDEESKDEEDVRTRGCLIELSNLSEKSTKESIKLGVCHFARPQYVDYERGEEKAIVRFSDSILADSFLEKYKDGSQILNIGGNLIKARSIDGEQELKYLQLVKEKKKSFHTYYHQRKKFKHN